MRVDGIGPKPAKVMLVGEAPGAEEELRGRPFVGSSGMFLDECLKQVGMERSEVFLTNIARARPPENKIEHFFVHHKKRIPGLQIVEGVEALKKEITEVQPNIIVAMGDTALWAIAEGSPTGILKWRGSLLQSKAEFGSRKVIPTVHPAYILRQFSDRPLLLADLTRARIESGFGEIRFPERRFIIQPTLSAVIEWLTEARKRGLYSCDIETLGGSVTCIGIGLSRSEVMCIPFIDPRKPDAQYWTEDEHVLVMRALRELFLSPAECIGQNFAYDAFFLAMKWGIPPRVRWDIMVMHHLLFSSMKKSLHFMASLYCKYYRYWKDDGKLWNPKKTPPEQLWLYNCEDLAYTWELYEHLRPMLERAGLMEQYEFQIGEVWPFAREMELRGVRIDKERKERLARELLEYQLNTMQEIEYVLGHPLNPRSTPQMRALFYGDLGEREIRSRVTGQPTLDDGALDTIAKRSPHLRRLVQRVQDYRSAGVLLSSYAQMPLDSDGRARCTFNITGTETFRFSSSANPFGSGGNLQTISKGDEDEQHEPGRLVAPNLRQMFLPDPGYTWLDIDLEKADLVTVACEAEDEELLQQLESGYNPYREAAAKYLKLAPEDVPHTTYTRYKSMCHAYDYVGRPPTVARNTGLLVSEAELFYHWWFGEHPGIPRWHRRLEAELRARRTVRNIFGYRTVYFDRLDGLLPEAAAWIGQSTTAITINKALTRIRREVPEAEMLLQVHDSGDIQVRTERLAQVLPRIRECFRVVLPYKRPAVIGFELKLSDRSWGHVDKPAKGSTAWRAWNEVVQCSTGETSHNAQAI